MKKSALYLLAGLLLSVQAHAAPEACGTLEGAVHGQGPMFLASFPAAEPGPQRDAAFTYDNAVAAIALVACGNTKQAEQIGDALLTGLNHDRFWKDGRLRNAYLAGPVASLPVKLPGWWDTAQNKWVEDGYQVGSDTGNMAWSILALLTISEATGSAKYREGAQRIARYVETSLSRVKPVGFDGGSFGDEPAPFRNRWKSTEHNTDLAAAFARLGSKRARLAETFVHAMWQQKCQCFAAGTTDDGHTRNTLLALDAQIWPLMALPGAAFPGVLGTVDARLRQAGGYTFAEGSRGIWTEGTAQTALLLSLSGQHAEAQKLLTRLHELRALDGYYYATDSTELKTGLAVQTDTSKPRSYFHEPHLAALAWVALAETGFNPFTGTKGLPAGHR